VYYLNFLSDAIYVIQSNRNYLQDNKIGLPASINKDKILKHITDSKPAVHSLIVVKEFFD
jgi:hypothetical protein